MRAEQAKYLQELEKTYHDGLLQINQYEFDNIGRVEDHIITLESMINCLKTLAILNPKKHQKMLRHFQQQLFFYQHPLVETISEPMTGNATSTMAEDKDELKSPEVIATFIGPLPNAVHQELVSILSRLIDLNQFMREKNKETTQDSSSKRVTIAIEFVAKVQHAQEKLELLTTDIFILSDKVSLPCHQKLFSQIHFQLSQAKQLEHDMSLKFLKFMITFKDFEHLNMVKHKAISLPKNLFYSLIKDDLGDILWQLIDAGQINIYTPESTEKPYSLIEKIIREKKLKCFEALQSHALINLLMPCHDQRPLISLILQLNPVNPIRQLCIKSHPQLSSPAFYNQAKKLLDRFQITTETTIHIIERDLACIALLKNDYPIRKELSKIGQFSLFTDTVDQTPLMDFLQTSWFQEKFQEFETLRLDFRNKLSRSHQTFFPHDREQFRLFSEKNLTRLSYLLEFMTEHEAKFAVELSLSHLKTSIAYFDIKETLKSKKLKGGKKQRQELESQAAYLQAKISSDEQALPTTADNIEYPGLHGETLELLKKVDFLVDLYDLTKDKQYVERLLEYMGKFVTLEQITEAPVKTQAYLSDYAEYLFQKLTDAVPESIKKTFNDAFALEATKTLSV